MVVLGPLVSLTAVYSLISGMYAMMAIPTMISTLILSPKVMVAAKAYFHGL